ncbi:hypothetical protein [Cohnella thailandensis]|uniref:Uncharacterized protein n=1 Tax=Cohnella thailandensis TaxID=557557 RepID=A0A841T5D3_9BACL|nr:hypothetical protein [Cohnella thailandensis]MBB6638066.1 hypothetical protein [Cohnella thailandensis]MBP1972008.1 hypothetical protein [Cohnella thailandensis]
MSAGQASQAIVYQAESPWIDQVKQTRRKLAELCGKHDNRPVRIQTIDGHTYEGTIVGTDGCHVHLMHFPQQGGHQPPQHDYQQPYGQQSPYGHPSHPYGHPSHPYGHPSNPYGHSPHSHGQHRFFGPSSAAAITTLVLYELLVITLLI